MGLQLFAGTCILICFAALYFAWKVYKDASKFKKKAEEEDETIGLE